MSSEKSLQFYCSQRRFKVGLNMLGALEALDPKRLVPRGFRHDSLPGWVLLPAGADSSHQAHHKAASDDLRRTEFPATAPASEEGAAATASPEVLRSLTAKHPLPMCHVSTWSVKDVPARS